MSNTQPIVVIFDDFQTINQKLDRRQLPRNVGYDAKNLRYDTEYGSLAKRLSRAKYNSTALGISPIKGLHRYYKNSLNSGTLIAVYSGILKIGYDDTGVFSDIKTGLNATNFFSFQTYKDLEYIFNGTDTNMVFTKLTGTTAVENMGIPSLLILPSVTLSLTVGVLSGTLFYATSQQLDSYQEGNVSPTTTGVLATGSQIRLVIPTSTNTRCTGMYVYRNQSGGSTLYRLTTITNNTAANTYVDNTKDTSLDTTITAPIDYGLPAVYKYVCLHKGRVFLAGNPTNQSDVVYSDIRNNTGYPDVFPTNNILYIAKDDGDKITAILNDHFGQLVVFKKNSVRIINTTADSDLTWDISDSLSTEGCIAPYSAVTTPMGIIYLTRYGEHRKRIVLWTGSKIQVIPQLEGIEPILTAIPDTALDDVRGHYQNGYYYLAYRTGGLYNENVLLINIIDWSCTIDKKNISAFCAWNGGNDFGELYTGTSDETGFIYREDTAEYDLLIRKKSEFDQGTFSYTTSSGQEATPSLGLSSTISTGIGTRTWASMTGAGTLWQDLTAFNDTWWLTGEWLDIVRDISAKILLSLYWKEVKPTDTEVVFYIRTGDTTTACQSATWNGPYTNPDGSSLSSVTAAKYIQIKANLAVKSYNDYTNVFVYRSGTEDSDYAIKISANYGNPAETTIEFDWQSGRIDLGDINEVYKRLRKRLRSVKIEFERTSTSGSFDFRWYLNGATSSSGSSNHSFSSSLTAKIYHFPLTNFCEDFIYQIYSNTDIESLKIKRVIFTVNVEPYYARI